MQNYHAFKSWRFVRNLQLAVGSGKFGKTSPKYTDLGHNRPAVLCLRDLFACGLIKPKPFSLWIECFENPIESILPRLWLCGYVN